MSDSTSRTKGTEAPAIAAIRAANASLLGQDRDPAQPFKREGYAAETSRGYSTAMGRGLELAVCLAVMVLLGIGADRLFGTAPIFVILFSVLGFAGITVKLFLGYDLEMKKHEEGAIWNRKADTAS
ncbi:MAG TPA: AtpZ/AtpI family protein [Acidimicrobiales bacterium]|jgi:F0F1-type ATP synthase assembly protein I|nr:AtpZ/AtpI family protein [Acidimicrobiales bacterium]